MRTVVATGMWGQAWERYGQDFAETFARFWPSEVELIVYSDRWDFTLPRGKLRNLHTIPGYDPWMARFAGDPVARGKEKAPHADWKPGDIKGGYSWSHDAVKWAPQAMIPADVARGLSDPVILAWIDADVITTGPVPTDWVDKVIGPYHGAYLGRRDAHSEIGFWAVRLPAGRVLVERFAGLYLNAGFLSARQSHSAYIWDMARKALPELEMRDLSPGGFGHVFPTSILATCLEHRKGHLKPA